MQFGDKSKSRRPQNVLCLLQSGCDKDNGKLGINKYSSRDQKMGIIPSECLIFSPVSPPRSRQPGAGAGNHLGWETTRTKPAPAHNNHGEHVREDRMSDDLVMVQVSQVDLLVGADLPESFKHPDSWKLLTDYWGKQGWGQVRWSENIRVRWLSPGQAHTWWRVMMSRPRQILVNMSGISDTIGELENW